MALYYFTDSGKFKNNLRKNVFDTYHVGDYQGKQIHTDRLCDRTNHVVAWKKFPKKYWMSDKEVKELIE